MSVSARYALFACSSFLSALTIADAVAQTTSTGSGQAYPNRVIRMVVPLAAGGGTDLTGRIVSQKLGEQMGATIVVDNRPGAGSVIGTEWSPRPSPTAIR